MKSLLAALLIAMIMPVVMPGDISAKDMRVMHEEADRQRQRLLMEVKAREMEAKKEAEASLARIARDRRKLVAEVEKMRRARAALMAEKKSLAKKIKGLEKLRAELEKKAIAKEAGVKETIGFIRANAKDLLSMLNSSPQSAFDRERGKELEALVEKTAYPGIGYLHKMVDLLFDEIKRSGEVVIKEGAIIDRKGEETGADILMLGNLSFAYKTRDETGFLLYSDKSRRMFALSRLPSKRYYKKIDAYMAGEVEDVPMDITGGAALRQMTRRLSLWEQVPKGGPIVWPILGIGLLGLLIILERFIFLTSTGLNADRFMARITGFIDRRAWEECIAFCRSKKNKPVARIILKGVQSRKMEREELENVLQEAILREIPRLERFISTLGMLAAISPLLGLLGTVTGMINTFHAITYFGTGNPRIMSGGISEALVTTMLGLSIAVPIMLAHTLLSGRIENRIATMEEKAVSLVNRLYKEKDRG